MLFTTIQFAMFFLLVLTINWALKERTGQYKWFLLAVNAVFYGSLNVRYLPLLPVVGLANWWTARLIVRSATTRRKKAILAADVVFNLGLLAFFKYFEFFFEALETAALAVGLSSSLLPAEIMFPVGISFFTFMGLSYAIDVYRDPGRLVENPLDVLLFVSFFPTVLSGPILRAGRFIPQLTRSDYDPEAFRAGYALILAGLFKKIVIASYLSEHIVRQVFQVPDQYSSWTVLAAIYAYSIQIYCDFSGYSDLAMGLALLLGFEIPENFRRPYTATNLREFWRRWHISLSTWLRDYLYISLGGNRLGDWGKYRNLMITMVLGGLWHGAHDRFLLWGALHGLGLTATHVFSDLMARRGKKKLRYKRVNPRRAGLVKALKTALAWLATFHFVSFLWVFFRAEDAGRAMEIILGAFDFSKVGDGFELLVIPAILTGLLIQFWGERLRDLYLNLQGRLPFWLQGAALALLCILILKLGPEGVLPFIYFQF